MSAERAVTHSLSRHCWLILGRCNPRLLSTHDEVLVLDSPADLPASYDLKAAREALEDSVGALSGIDSNAFLRDLHQARSQKGRNFLK